MSKALYKCPPNFGYVLIFLNWLHYPGNIVQYLGITHNNCKNS